MSYRDSSSSGYRGSRRGTSTVYVGDIPRSARQEDIEKAFRYYGSLKHCWISTNPWGYGFVEYYDSKDAEDSIRGLDGKSFSGGRLRVELSHGKGRTRGGTVSVPRYPPRRNYPNSSYDRYGHSNERYGHSGYHNSRRIRSRSRSRERSYRHSDDHQHSQRSISRSRSASRDRTRSNGSRDKSSKTHSNGHHHKSSRHHKKSKKSRKSRSRSKSATPEQREKSINKSNSPKSNNDDLHSLISDNSLPSTLNGDGHMMKETGSNHDLSYENVSNTEIAAN